MYGFHVRLARTSSVFAVWSAELTQIIRSHAMEGLENHKTDLVLNTLRHTQPMKPITQKAGHRCPPTRMAEKTRCRIHYLLEPVQSAL